MKYSKQRETIRQAVEGTKQHPTAETVYEWVRRQNPGIGLATVYRNLNSLAEQGALRKIRVASGADRFDGQLHRHSHLVCRKCREMIDLAPETMGGIAEEIRRATGFEPAEEEIVIYGICKQCLEKEKGEEK